MGLATRQWTSVLRMGAAVILAAALCACAAVRPPELAPPADLRPGELFGADARPLPLDELVRRAAHADYVLLGESHSSACDHRVQADVLDAMAARGPAPVLGLEMVPAELQPVLDRFNAGELGVDDLPGALDWETAWGHPFALYRPVLEAARRTGAPLAGLNVPRRVVRAVGEGGPGAVARADRHLLPVQIIPPAPEQASELERVLARHAAPGHGDGEDGAAAAPSAQADRRERFLRVQALWDTAMARSAVAARRAQGRPVLLLAGAGHVERGWGIARRLHALDPRARVLAVLPWRGGSGFDPADADAFFFCPLSHSSRLGFVLQERDARVSVTDVAPDTRAAQAGFLPGDEILAVMGEPATSLWVLHKGALKAGRAGLPLAITVRRDGQVLELAVPLTGVGGGPGALREEPGPAPDAAPQGAE
ncbi:ChaN family lipoprotein [Desulfocurvus vexinensis]|uniref:ChaN family lipoprotein n=1 Tax=Desulfocurvus vexinensis TaxID=399548 RepID=UPI0012EB0EF3|nr:ChaN family lipoprotein [Desulfocurvus vexinensis]